MDVGPKTVLKYLASNFGPARTRRRRPRRHGARAAEDLPYHQGRRTEFGSRRQGIGTPIWLNVFRSARALYMRAEKNIPPVDA